MTTDSIRTRLYNKKLADYSTLRTKLLDYLVSEFRQLHADAYTTDSIIDALAATVAPSGNNAVDVAAALPLNGVSGTGKRFLFEAADPRLQDVLIPPDAATVYHIGLEQNDVEQGIETNPRTGEAEYLEYVEELGRVATPTSVVDNGDDTLTINVNSLCESGKDYSGRDVRVWLKSRADGGIGPLSATEAIAIQTITIAYGAPHNTITVPNLMGQATASVTAADYKVMLLGPVVKRAAFEDLRTTSGCLFLAAITSVAAANPIVTISTADQTVAHLNWITGVMTGDFNVTDNLTVGDKIASVGADLLGSEANSLLSRINVPHSATYDLTLLFSSPPDAGGTPTIRLYGDINGTFAITVNASYDGSVWAKDQAGVGATMTLFGEGDITTYSRPSATGGTWANWAQTLAITGAVATTLANNSYEPLFQMFDADENRRVAVDHIGLLRTPFFSIHQNWIAPMLAAWTEVSTGAASNNAELGYNGLMPGVWLRHTVVADTEIASERSPRLVSGATYQGVIAVLECTIDAGDLAGTPALVYQFGLIHDESVEPSTEDFVKVYKTAASANWFFKSYGSTAVGGTDVDTGVPATGHQRIRIELHGANAPGGARAQCWIDGTMVGDITALLPDTQEMLVMSYLRSTGAVNKNVYVSPINITLNRVLTDDPV